ncbi:Capsular glucan synthase [compost metagenome]
MKLETNVEFIGMRYDVNKWMSAADVFVLSSAWEGFGLVVAEAMACERIVVATDCGGVKEVVGDCGYLVPPNDSTQLGNALSQALKLSELQRVQLGNSARRRIIESYSLASVSERWLSIYQCKSYLNNSCKDVN